MPISNGRCSQGPKWAMQLWLDLRPLLGVLSFSSSPSPPASNIIQHHPTRYSHPPKKSGCVGTSWCHVFHQLHGLHPAGRHDSPQQHVLRPPAAPPNAGDAGQMARRNGRNGSRRWWKWEQERPSGRFRIARMDDWWYDIYVVILLGDLWNV